MIVLSATSEKFLKEIRQKVRLTILATAILVKLCLDISQTKTIDVKKFVAME